jgi:hypothetical protein
MNEETEGIRKEGFLLYGYRKCTKYLIQDSGCPYDDYNRIQIRPVTPEVNLLN